MTVVIPSLILWLVGLASVAVVLALAAVGFMFIWAMRGRK